MIVVRLEITLFSRRLSLRHCRYQDIETKYMKHKGKGQHKQKTKIRRESPRREK
jgi:hypothetical protein